MTERNGAPIAFALFEPDIPQNTGNLIRTGACLGMRVHVIEPCGFALSDSRMRRAGMDYAERAALVRHASWQAFNDTILSEPPSARTVLLSTKADTLLQDFSFQPGDILLLGRESAGVPDHVHDGAGARVKLPMADGLRSMNVAVAGAIAAFEALRQLQALPGSETIAP